MLMFHICSQEQIRDGEVDGLHEGTQALVDIALLAQTDAFVLKLTSNFDRIVLELAGGQRGCMPPYISMDADWCFGYGAPEPSPSGRGGGWAHGRVTRGPHAGNMFLC
jgi:hypothetical protein